MSSRHDAFVAEQHAAGLRIPDLDPRVRYRECDAYGHNLTRAMLPSGGHTDCHDEVVQHIYERLTLARASPMRTPSYIFQSVLPASALVRPPRPPRQQAEARTCHRAHRQTARIAGNALDSNSSSWLAFDQVTRSPGSKRFAHDLTKAKGNPELSKTARPCGHLRSYVSK